MFQYIVQTIAFQLFFLLIYDVFLKKETFFNWNRIYLLGTTLLSLVIPLIKIESFKNVVSQDYIVRLPEVFIGNAPNETGFVELNPVIISNVSSRSIWEMIFFLGAFTALFLLVFKLVKLFRLFVKNPKQKAGNLNIVSVLNSSMAFSFFRYIFLGDQIPKKDKDAILKHEIVHVSHYHSIDLLFFEALRILFWFNPLIYMYQNRIEALHEFIADARVIESENKQAYYQNLLSQVFETKEISFINPFFKQSLIKKRIVMLTRTRSKQINLLKYALLIPIVTGMLIYSACTVQNELVNQSVDLNKFTYILKLDKGNYEMSDDVMNKHQKYEAFLKSHPEYVGKANFDKEAKIVTYSIHPIEEPMPEDFTKVSVDFPDGGSYNTYMNFDKTARTNQSIGVTGKYLKGTDVPFGVIDQVPVFPGCENLPKEEQRACMAKNISMHVNRNFNTKIAEEYGLTGRQRINVIFKIDKEGNITDIRSRAPHPSLEEEAIRVINTLPKVIPGEHKGKKVNVPYSLPIIFQVTGGEKQDSSQFNNTVLNPSDVPFTIIDKAPVFPGCENLPINEQKQCVSKGVTKHVVRNFNTELAKKIGLEGRQPIHVIFKIDKEGNITDVRSRAPHPSLEEEAIRVINTLPKMIPGEHKGKKVNVPYSLPIIFQIAGDNKNGETNKIEIENNPNAAVIVGYK